jgi:hypothetical protein
MPVNAETCQPVHNKFHQLTTEFYHKAKLILFVITLDVTEATVLQAPASQYLYHILIITDATVETIIP